MSNAVAMGFIRFFTQRHFDYVISGVFRSDCYLSTAVQTLQNKYGLRNYFSILYRSIPKNLRRNETKNDIKTICVNQTLLSVNTVDMA